MVGGTCEGERTYDVLLLNEQRGNNVCAGGSTIREWYVDTDNSGDFNSGDAYCRQVITVTTDSKFDHTRSNGQNTMMMDQKKESI